MNVLFYTHTRTYEQAASTLQPAYEQEGLASYRALKFKSQHAYVHTFELLRALTYVRDCFVEQTGGVKLASCSSVHATMESNLKRKKKTSK